MNTANSPHWYPACAMTDLVPESGVAVKINGQQIALFYLPQHRTVYAVSNYCPCSDANVIARGILGDVAGKLVVASPLYKQHFCLRSGQCLEDERYQLTVFACKIDHDRLYLAL